jgi:hypothetical protein
VRVRLCERVALQQVERGTEASQDEHVATIIGARDACGGEEVEAGFALAVTGREVLEQVPQRGDGRARSGNVTPTRRGREEAEGRAAG